MCALKFFINPCFKIENKTATMFRLKSRSATASETVAKRPYKSIILEEMVKVIQRM
jgi:predicted metalloprotease